MRYLEKTIPLLLLTALSGCVTPNHELTTANALPKEQIQDSMAAQNRLVKIEVTTNGVTSSGGGVWLGNGRVLTATHLFLDMKSPSDPIFIVWRDKKLKATPVFHGEPPDNDLILLKVDPEVIPGSLAKVTPPQVCSDVEPIDQRVYVTAHDRTYWTYTSPAGTIRYKDKKWSNSTTALLSHGVSGSPLYDDKSSCLAGIVSRMELGSLTNLAESEQVACERATLQMLDTHEGVTCSIEPRTIFMTSELIQEFLKQAAEYEQTHNTK